MAPRPPIAPVILGGMVSVVVFDGLGSLAAKLFGFNYALLLGGTILIYGAVAGVVARRRDWHVGVLAAAVMAFTDLTLGWAISWLIGPGRPPGGLTPTTVLGAVMTAFVVAGIAGTIGAWVGLRNSPSGSRSMK